MIDLKLNFEKSLLNFNAKLFVNLVRQKNLQLIQNMYSFCSTYFLKCHKHKIYIYIFYVSLWYKIWQNHISMSKYLLIK